MLLFCFELTLLSYPDSVACLLINMCVCVCHNFYQYKFKLKQSKTWLFLIRE